MQPYFCTVEPRESEWIEDYSWPQGGHMHDFNDEREHYYLDFKVSKDNKLLRIMIDKKYSECDLIKEISKITYRLDCMTELDYNDIEALNVYANILKKMSRNSDIWLTIRNHKAS